MVAGAHQQPPAAPTGMQHARNHAQQRPGLLTRLFAPFFRTTAARVAPLGSAAKAVAHAPAPVAKAVAGAASAAVRAVAAFPESVRSAWVKAGEQSRRDARARIMRLMASSMRQGGAQLWVFLVDYYARRLKQWEAKVAQQLKGMKKDDPEYQSKKAKYDSVKTRLPAYAQHEAHKAWVRIMVFTLAQAAQQYAVGLTKDQAEAVRNNLEASGLGLPLDKAEALAAEYEREHHKGLDARALQELLEGIRQYLSPVAAAPQAPQAQAAHAAHAR
jgi:hypothetical protein